MKHVLLSAVILFTTIPVYAVSASPEGFYQFARKSAELYRGRLFSKPEIDLFVEEISRQTKEAPAILKAFKKTPYDIQKTAQTLSWLGQHCQGVNCDKLQDLKARLELHYNMLLEVAKTYEG